jgi:hypothetical protein
MKGSGKKAKKTKAVTEIISGSLGTFMSGLATMGNLIGGQPTQALITGSILAPSVYGIVKGSKRLKKGKGLNPTGGGLLHKNKHLSHEIVSVAKLKKFIKSHVDNQPFHISDLKIPKRHINKVLGHLDIKTGEGLKSTLHKAKKKLGKFFRGETKYKPSDLLGDISKVAGISSVFIPQMAIPAMMANAGQQYALSTGRGKQGAGLYPTGYKHTKPYYSGMKLPVKIKKFIETYPNESKEIANRHVVSMEKIGSGSSGKKVGTAFGAIGLAGLSGLAGAVAYNQYLQRNPSKAFSIAGRSFSNSFF